ncbi:DUF4192 family protein [Nonomuraea dietziae]|uniref:DUF4192 family protein n=1 Tax=Nonomuraea dietziae TaxID=65515 RepID=UPI0033F8F13E
MFSFTRTQLPAADNGPDPEDVRQATTRAWSRAHNMLTTVDDRYWLREGRSQVTQCLELLQRGHPIDADRLAWLGVLLTSHAVRDLAGVVAARYGQDLAALLWMECSRGLQPDYVPGAVFNLAVEAAAADQVVLARAAADRALEIDPHCSCARALLCLLDIGARPQSIREAFDPATCESILRAAELRPYSARPVLPAQPTRAA